ncbi:hypothetical protein BT93_L0443 [Corymbia citriodora subsp. variegata]|uniref:Uncharacterized protein n=1 Tax=Corymbia citriodora subsp. variegata TaxID=360336 RepID=A0A8T0CTK4_CORYI|nr:hypothetical protein BT93_L0443 [Corymbia citriodora subsp. variegata]KAF7849637.1 hypothetical protein BT93_L0443 [Corymbia citriodora subsp. variegata]
MATAGFPPRQLRSSSSLLLLLLLLLSAAAPSPVHSLSYSQYKTLLSLAHSLATRVANLRSSRGDLAGADRARAIAQRLRPGRWLGLGPGFWRSAWSMGWDYARNYAWGWRDLEYREMYGAASDLGELLSLLGEFARAESEAERARWIGRNYGNALRVSKSVFARLLRVFSKSGPLREMVETMHKEVVDGDFLRDCLELGSNDLKGLIQILKDLTSQYHSSPDHGDDL